MAPISSNRLQTSWIRRDLLPDVQEKRVQLLSRSFAAADQEGPWLHVATPKSVIQFFNLEIRCRTQTQGELKKPQTTARTRIVRW